MTLKEIQAYAAEALSFFLLSKLCPMRRLPRATVDVYGSGHTPDENPENKLYDGTINTGYAVWSEFIYEQLQTQKPWRISEGFIEALGGKYLLFKATNSIYQGHIDIATIGGFR